MVHLQNAYPQAAIAPRSLPPDFPSSPLVYWGLLECQTYPSRVHSYLLRIYLAFSQQQIFTHLSVYFSTIEMNDSKSDLQVRFNPLISVPLMQPS